MIFLKVEKIIWFWTSAADLAVEKCVQLRISIRCQTFSRSWGSKNRSCFQKQYDFLYSWCLMMHVYKLTITIIIISCNLGPIAIWCLTVLFSYFKFFGLKAARVSLSLLSSGTCRKWLFDEQKERAVARFYRSRKLV